MLDPLKMPAHFSEQLYARQVRLVQIAQNWLILLHYRDKTMTVGKQGEVG